MFYSDVLKIKKKIYPGTRVYLPTSKFTKDKTFNIFTAFDSAKSSLFQKGFTYIELLITLAIIAVLFVPMMQLFSHSLYSTGVSQGLITAVNLAKWEMERTKNLNIIECLISKYK